MREVVFILTDHGEHGVGISSPQLPGLVAGVASFDEATPTHLLGLARDSGAEVDGFSVFVERLVEADGRVIAIRCRQDFAINERARIAEALERELVASADARDGWLLNALGDSVLIVALGRDRIGDLAQAEREGEPFAVVVARDTSLIARGVQSPGPEDSALTADEYVSRLTGATSGGSSTREVVLTG